MAKIESFSAHLYDPATKEGGSYKFEVTFTKRDGLFWIFQPTKAEKRAPDNFKCGSSNSSYKVLKEEFKAKCSEWNEQVHDDAKKKVILYRFEASLDKDHNEKTGYRLSGKEFFSSFHSEYAKDARGCYFKIQYWVGYRSTTAPLNNLRHYNMDGHLERNLHIMTDSNVLDWTQEREDFFKHFNDSMSQRLKDLAQFLQDDQAVLDTINKTKQLPFFS